MWTGCLNPALLRFLSAFLPMGWVVELVLLFPNREAPRGPEAPAGSLWPLSCWGLCQGSLGCAAAAEQERGRSSCPAQCPGQEGWKGLGFSPELCRHQATAASCSGTALFFDPTSMDSLGKGWGSKTGIAGISPCLEKFYQMGRKQIVFSSSQVRQLEPNFFHCSDLGQSLIIHHCHIWALGIPVWFPWHRTWWWPHWNSGGVRGSRQEFNRSLLIVVVWGIQGAHGWLLGKGDSCFVHFLGKIILNVSIQWH